MAQQLPVSVKITSDSTDAQKDVKQLEGSLDKLGTSGGQAGAALGKVGTTGQQTGTALDKLGATGKQAAVGLDQQSDAVGRGTKALTAHGVSAGQTAQAMRQLPAQMTDIFTSLQGGMPVMTVLIQQGGQIKDSFGGIGPAFKQLASLVTVARVAMLGSLAAVAAVAMAYKAGSAEADAYNKALIMSGNAAGTSAGQLGQMAASISKVVGTQGAAAEALALMAGSGRVASQNLQQFSTTAVQMDRTLGQSVGETVKIFAELGKAPLATTLKLNETYRYLTVAVYEQIRALQLKGREDQAGEVAQKAYDSAMATRSQQIKANLGVLEKSWIVLGDAAKKSWDFMLGIGRADTLQTKLDKVAADIAKAREKFDPSAFGGNAEARANLGKNLQQQAYLQEDQRREKRGTASQSETAKVTEEYVAAQQANEKWTDAALTNQQKITKALETYRQNLAKVNAGREQEGKAPLSATLQARQEAEIRKSLGEGSLQNAAVASGLKLAQVKADLSVLLDAFKNSDAVIEQALKDGNVTLEAAFAVRLANLKGDTKAQREALLADRAEVDKEIARAQTTSERGAGLQKRIQIDAQVKLLDASLKKGTRQLSIWKTEQERQLANITAKVRVEVANLTGKFDRSAVEDQLKAQFDGDYKAAGQQTDPAKQAAQIKSIDLLVAAGVAQAEFNAKLGEAQRIQSALAVQEEAIRLQATQGIISQTEAEARITQARKAQVPALQDIVDKLREMRAAMPPDAAVALDQMSASIGKLQNETKAATPVLVDMGTKLKNTAIDGLADAAANAVTNFSNLGDVVKSTMKQMAADILRSGVKRALTDALTPGTGGGGGFFSTLFSAGKSLFGFAEGGHIQGPGSGTSDSIAALVDGVRPIAVSNNEFIQPDKAVRKYGLGFMEAVRTLRLPKPQFAFGGLVQAHQQARFATGGHVAGAGALGAAPNVSIQFVNNGTPQRVVQQSQQVSGKDLVVRVILADLATGGPISQAQRNRRRS